MSKMKSTLAATFLTLVLAFPSLGGVIGSPGGTPPPPPPPPITETNSAGSVLPGETGTPGLVTSSLVDILMAVLSLI
ncbi:MAG: hypothetical protein ABR568_02910 [Pyrinomonadaceae bacterium]